MKHIFLFIAVSILFNCKPEKEEPKPLTAPVLTTMEAGDITAISALSGGAISSDGGSPVTARGIVWGISHNPTLADSVSEEGTGIGSFTSDLTPLKYSTTYYVRAYATNSIGTTYGNEITFNTKAAVPSDGLVGWWPFNENANDESGNGNDGVVDGPTMSTDRFNYMESSYLFDQNQIQNITVPSSLSLTEIKNVTINLWVNLNSNSTVNYNRYINKGFGGNYHFVFANQWVGMYFYYNTEFYNTNILPPLNGWHMLTLTYNYIEGGLDNFGRFFVDGIEVDFFITSRQLIPIENDLYFGSEPNSSGQTPDGSIDDIAIYNRALTAEEIQNIYNGTGF